MFIVVGVQVGSDKNAPLRVALGPLIALGVIAAFELIPALPKREGVVFATLLGVVAVASFAGALTSGLITAGTLIAYAAYFCFQTGRVDGPIQHFIALTVSAVAVA